MRHALLLACLVLAACVPSPERNPAAAKAPAASSTPADPRPRFVIPRLARIAVDGGDDDWGAQGLRVAAFAEDGPQPTAPEDLAAQLRLAWTGEGLAALVELRSREPWSESTDARTAYERDSVELFLRTGSQWRNLVQPVIAPGMAPGQDQPRSFVWDYRGPAAEWASLPTAVTVARSRIPGGFRLEVVIPWAQLRVRPESGTEVEFRCNLNKVLPAGRRQLVWRSADGSEFQRLVLGDSASPVPDSTAWAVRTGTDGTAICAIAPAARAGSALVVERDGNVLATATLMAEDGRACTALVMPGLAAGPLRLSLAGIQIGAGRSVDAAAEMRRALERAAASRGPRRWGDGDRLRPRVPSILSPGPPPQAEIADMDGARRGGLSGLQVRWFDAAGTQVDTITTPGRHGAEITMRMTDGTALTVCQTAYLPAASAPRDALVSAWAPAAAAAAASDPQVDEALARSDSRSRSALDDAGLAALLSAAAEAGADGGAIRPWSRDAAWWHGQRTRLGTATAYRWSRRLPEGYDADRQRRWPAIIYLHGSGGELPRDYGDLEQRLASASERDLLGWARQHPQPFAIYALMASSGWEPLAVADAVRRILAEDRIDPDRVVIMGFSMGGMGTWDCAVELPGLWAAAVPIGGRGNRAREVSRLGRLPVWSFNGDADNTTTLADARSASEALAAAGGDVRLTVLPGIDHGGSQDATFSTPGLWQWLAGQRRQAASR